MLDTITPANIAHGVRIALNHTVIASAPLMRTQYALNRAANTTIEKQAELRQKTNLHNMAVARQHHHHEHNKCHRKHVHQMERPTPAERVRNPRVPTGTPTTDAIETPENTHAMNFVRYRSAVTSGTYVMAMATSVPDTNAMRIRATTSTP